MSALLNPVNGVKRNVKWALAAHTTAMFATLAIPVAIRLAMESDAWVDNRKFPGGDLRPAGPYGYPWPNNLSGLHSLGFRLNQWLADGILAGSMLGAAGQALNTACCYRCIVVMLFIARNFG